MKRAPRISPDMGPGGLDPDPEAEAIAWCLEQGLVWTEDGWVDPDEVAAPAAP